MKMDLFVHILQDNLYFNFLFYLKGAKIYTEKLNTSLLKYLGFQPIDEVNKSYSIALSSCIKLIDWVEQILPGIERQLRVAFFLEVLPPGGGRSCRQK